MSTAIGIFNSNLAVHHEQTVEVTAEWSAKSNLLSRLITVISRYLKIVKTNISCESKKQVNRKMYAIIIENKM